MRNNKVPSAHPMDKTSDGEASVQHHQSSVQRDKQANCHLAGPMMGAGAHGAAQPTQAQIAQQQQAQMQANELAKRRSRKPTDKSIPDGVEEHIVNPDAVQRYKELRDLERLLDSTITRKRLDVLESAQRPSKVSSVRLLNDRSCMLTRRSNTEHCESGFPTPWRIRLGKATASALMRSTSHRRWRLRIGLKSKVDC